MTGWWLHFWRHFAIAGAVVVAVSVGGGVTVFVLATLPVQIALPGLIIVIVLLGCVAYAIEQADKEEKQ